MESENKVKQITAVLKLNSSNEEIIEIPINGITYSLNFTKEDQTYLRDFFKVCINELFVNEFEFTLDVDDVVKNEIIIRVAKEYIHDLNNELKSCLAEINKKTD